MKANAKTPIHHQDQHRPDKGRTRSAVAGGGLVAGDAGKQRAGAGYGGADHDVSLRAAIFWAISRKAELSAALSCAL